MSSEAVSQRDEPSPEVQARAGAPPSRADDAGGPPGSSPAVAEDDLGGPGGGSGPGDPASREAGTDSESARSLRTQLLWGLALLLVVALLAIVVAGLAWLPLGLSPLWFMVGLAILIAVDVAILLLFGDYLVRRMVTRPIERMVKGAEEIAEGHQERRLVPVGATELRRLAHSVNRMADRLIRHRRELEANIESLNATNRALTEAKNELVHAEKLASVGRLAAGVAHEIGNPLNAIMGYLDLARRRGQGDSEWVKGITHESSRIDRIVRGLLDYARPGAGELEPIGVNPVVRRAVDLLEMQGRFKRIRVELELEEGLPGVRADPHQLQQVLVNLLLNAADAVEETGPEGNIVVDTSAVEHEIKRPIERRKRRESDPEGVDYSHRRRLQRPPFEFAPGFRAGDRLVRIRVTDDGPGIEADHLSHLFDPFFTTKDPGRGTGLGLAVSDRLVDRMGGAIHAEPGPSGGSVFSILLPTVADGAAA